MTRQGDVAAGVRSGHVVLAALDVHWTSIHYCSHGLKAATVPVFGHGGRGYVEPKGLRYDIRAGVFIPFPP